MYILINGISNLQTKKVTVKQEDAEDTSESSTNPDEESAQVYEELFAAVMTATDPSDNNRPLHSMFQLKPSKKVEIFFFFFSVLIFI